MPKLIKNPIESHLSSLCEEAGQESFTEVAEILVRQQWYVGIYAIRYCDPAPDSIFYVVQLRQAHGDVIEIQDLFQENFGPVLDSAFYGTLPKALTCFYDSIKALVGKPNEFGL